MKFDRSIRCSGQPTCIETCKGILLISLDENCKKHNAGCAFYRDFEVTADGPEHWRVRLQATLIFLSDSDLRLIPTIMPVL